MPQTSGRRRWRVWKTVSPSFAFRPNWQPAVAPRSWPLGLLALWAMGLAGSFALVPLVRLAVRGRFNSELADEIDQGLAEGQAWVLAVIVIVMAPLMEEMIFRYPLTPRLQPLVVAVCAAAGAVWLGVFPQSWLGVPFGVVAVFFGVLSVAYYRRRAHFDWWSKRPWIAIYASVFAFGFIHGPNYSTDSVVNWVWLPVLVSPQLWIGLLFVIARVRYGFGVAFAHHALHNALVFVTIVVGSD